MPKTYADLLTEGRSRVRLVSLDECRKRFDAHNGYVFVDVREKDETRLGYIPGAVFLPRSYLEQQFEAKLPDKNAKLIVYCASGIRSVFAADQLQSLGYTHVESANPGFTRWKDARHPVETPADLTPAQRDRYSRHILLPEVGEKGQEKLLKSRVLLLGAGSVHRRRSTWPRRAWVRSASSTRTRSMPRTCSARSSTARRPSACPRSRAARSASRT